MPPPAPTHHHHHLHPPSPNPRPTPPLAANVDGRTREKLVRAFYPRHPRTDKLIAQRNWWGAVAPCFSQLSALLPALCFGLLAHFWFQAAFKLGFLGVSAIQLGRRLG